jgi:integrase
MAEYLNFTKAALLALPLPEGRARARYMDTRAPGLAVYVWRTGKRSFYYYRSDKGTPIEIKLGDVGDLSVEEARELALEAGVAKRKGQDVKRAVRGEAKEMTFGELFTWYMETYSKPRKTDKSSRYDQSRYDSYLSRWDQTPVSRVTRAAIRDLHAEVAIKHGPTANKLVDLVRSVFNRAIYSDKFEGVNPAIGVEKLREHSRDRRLTSDEMGRFFEALDAPETDRDVRDYVLLSLFTGQRQTNVLGMRWDEIDEAAGTWRIPMTKNGQPLVVPIGEPELEVLEQRKGNGSPYVFPPRHAAKREHRWAPKRGWKDLTDRAGVPDLRMHDLRRTLGSYMADTGASLPLIGKTLGHKSQAATAIYARLALDPVREAKAKAIEAMRKRP